MINSGVIVGFDSRTNLKEVEASVMNLGCGSLLFPL